RRRRPGGDCLSDLASLMRVHSRQPRARCVAAVAAVVGTMVCATADVRVRAQAANARFDALAALAEARMKEYGVPGVALGILADGHESIRGLGITNVEDPLPV